MYRMYAAEAKLCCLADGDGIDLVPAHHCLWSNLPAGPVPAQQLWGGLLRAVPLPAGNGVLCLPVLSSHPEGQFLGSTCLCPWS